MALLDGCESRGGKATADSLDVSADDTAPALPAPVPAQIAASRRSSRIPAPLSRLADSIAPYLVFAPVGEARFTAASRNGRLLVDIGRVDIRVRSDSAHMAAYREAVEKRSTVEVGSLFRIRGTWGAGDAKAVAVEVWNGRIALRLSGPAEADSLMRARSAVIATAFRADSETPAVSDSCDRAEPPAALPASRLAQVQDSLLAELRAGAQPPYERLRGRMREVSSRAVGCFGTSHVALAVSLRAGNVEWVHERIVLVDDAGIVTPLRVSDFRFRAHDLLQAFDADGDGVDDLATRATTERSGATTVLALDLKSRRLTRLTAGFAWEDQ